MNKYMTKEEYQDSLEDLVIKINERIQKHNHASVSSDLITYGAAIRICRYTDLTLIDNRSIGFYDFYPKAIE